MNNLPGEVRNVLYDLVLPGDDRDVYIVKKISDLLRLSIMQLPANLGNEASSMFYHDITLVFDPTGISGGTIAVKENVRETLQEMNIILTLHQVKSATLILSGNVWRYFAELYTLAELVRYLRVTCYIDGEQYQNLGSAHLGPTPNRLNIVMSQGYSCTKRALWMGLRCGDHARLNRWGPQRLYDEFKAQMRHLGDLPRRFPRALATSFRFPGVPQPRSSSSKAPPKLTVPLTVFIGPGSVMYSSSVAACSSRRTFDWNRWTRLSATPMVGPRASQAPWVSGTLLPFLANYKRVLTAEETRLLTYQETVAASSPPHPLPPVSTLNYEEGFGSWIGYAANELSISRRLSCLREEMLILHRITALMSQYDGLSAGHPSLFRLGLDGITRV